MRLKIYPMNTQLNIFTKKTASQNILDRLEKKIKSRIVYAERSISIKGRFA